MGHRYHDGVNLNIPRMLQESRIECFIKDEPETLDIHTGTKPPRIICARSDVGKLVFGPLFHPLDDAFFHSRYSVKHIPYRARPAALESIFGDSPVITIDYSSYESC